MKRRGGAGNGIERNIIATLIGWNGNNNAFIYGGAFVIAQCGNQAICLCAAHSIDDYRTRSKSNSTSNNIPPPLATASPMNEPMSTDRLHVFFLIDGKPEVCSVDQLNYIGGNDIALFTAVAKNGRNIFRNNFAVDLAVPTIGQEVGVMANIVTHKLNSSGESELSTNFEFRVGKVTEVEFGRGTLFGQNQIFRTTIPVTPGMSGCPVVSIGKEGDPLSAIGVVSSDFSPIESFSKTQSAGSSTMSMLWPAMGLRLNGKTSTKAGNYSALEMANEGFISDQTSAAKVEIVNDGETTKIVYRDAIHGAYSLKTITAPVSEDRPVET